MQLGNHLDANSNRVENLGAPIAANDAVRLSDLNSAVEGTAWKDSCRVATQTNITLSGPGATIDGVAMATDDRVLVRAQTTDSENGIYIYNGAAVAMTRDPAASTAAELEQAVVTIEEGTSAGASYRQTQVNFALGADSVLWTVFGTAAPAASETTAGVAELATQAETDAGTDDTRIVTPLKAKSASWRLRKFTQTIGDSSATSFNIDHNFGTRDVHVEIYRNSGNFDSVIADVTRPSTNRVTATFSVAPASNAYNVVVTG